MQDHEISTIVSMGCVSITIIMSGMPVQEMSGPSVTLIVNYNLETVTRGYEPNLGETIVCLTQVWQSLLPLFWDKTFEFAIQTWQTSLEHYSVYVQT